MPTNIYLITDLKPAEDDIIGSANYSDLIIRDLSGTELNRLRSDRPWCHSMLESKTNEFGFYPDGANAYLGNEFIGSTEI